jgi:uncharacterized protein (DUF302 family)
MVFKKMTFVALAALGLGLGMGPGLSTAVAADGLISIKSSYPALETMNRFEAQVKERGLTVFARIDHAAGATKIGKTLAPTELLIFGNSQGGTPLMECSQTAGIDLPLKVLVWENSAKQVWLGYNDPSYLAARHGASQCPVVENLKKTLAAISQAALSAVPK